MKLTERQFYKYLATTAVALIAFACSNGQNPPTDNMDNKNLVNCDLPPGPATTLPTTKLLFEHNSTDMDTGVHGEFDGADFTELCVFDPSGNPILAIKPRGQLEKLAMSGIFFESREPPNGDVSIASLFADFPEGQYAVKGTALDGTGITGSATLMHNIPAPPTVTAPADNAVVPPTGLVVSWNTVTQTIDGAPVTITGYEVIITKDVPDDPHGFSRPTLDVHVTPSQTSLTIPDEFLEAGTSYELEVLSLAEFGNQTISVSFFETE
jgi:hypothetical protein